MACTTSSNTTNQYTCTETNSLCSFAKYKTIDGMCITQAEETVMPFSVLPAGGYVSNKIRVLPGDFDWGEYGVDPFPCKSFLVWGDPLCCGGNFEIALFDGYQLIKNLKNEVVAIELNIVRRDISWVPASKIFDNWFPGKTHRRGEKLMIGTPIVSFKIEMIEDALCKLLGDLNTIYPDISSAPTPSCSGQTIKVRLGDSWQFYTDMSINNVCMWVPSQNVAGLASVGNFGSVKLSCPPPNSSEPTALSTGCTNLTDIQSMTTVCPDNKRIVNFPIAHIGGSNLKAVTEQINTTFTTLVSTPFNVTGNLSYTLDVGARLDIVVNVKRTINNSSGDIIVRVVDNTLTTVHQQIFSIGSSSDFIISQSLHTITNDLVAGTYTIEIVDSNMIVSGVYTTDVLDVNITQNNSITC